MYAIVTNNSDETGIQFEMDESKAREMYEKDKEENSDAWSGGGALLHITGNGGFNIGFSFSVDDEGVELLDTYGEE